jgi:hypothetical protein
MKKKCKLCGLIAEKEDIFNCDRCKQGVCCECCTNSYPYNYCMCNKCCEEWEKLMMKHKFGM